MHVYDVNDLYYKYCEFHAPRSRGQAPGWGKHGHMLSTKIVKRRASGSGGQSLGWGKHGIK